MALPDIGDVVTIPHVHIPTGGNVDLQVKVLAVEERSDGSDWLRVKPKGATRDTWIRASSLNEA